MEKVVLNANSREAQGKQVRKLRAQGLVPAVIYGHSKKSELIQMDGAEAEKAYRQAGGNRIIGLKVGDGRLKNVLFYDVQRDPLKDRITHADFYIVKMDEELKAEVPIHFIGESVAVYQQEGSLLKNLEAVEVECLPANLPESFVVDISVLDDFEKVVTLADLQVPEGVKILNDDMDTLIVRVEAPRSDAELEELDTEVVAELPEGVQEEAPEVIADNHEEDADRLTKK